MRFKEIGLNIQRNWQDLYDHLMNTRIYTSIMLKIFMSSRNYEESGCDLNLDLLAILY